MRLPKNVRANAQPHLHGTLFRKLTSPSAALRLRIGSVTPSWRLASVLLPPTVEWCFALETTKATHRVALAGRDSDAVC